MALGIGESPTATVKAPPGPRRRPSEPWPVSLLIGRCPWRLLGKRSLTRFLNALARDPAECRIISNSYGWNSPFTSLFL
jgi:hypothetical protein